MDGNCNVYDELSIKPGYNDGLTNGWIAGWSNIYYTSNWATDHSPQNDWAIIVLDRDIGNNTGWCGIQYYDSNSDLIRKTGYAYGYPGGQSLGYFEYQWMTSGFISSVNSTEFDIGTLFGGGISGGPVYLEETNGMIVGMCKGAYLDYDDLSVCTRITQNMVDIVNGI